MAIRLSFSPYPFEGSPRSIVSEFLIFLVFSFLLILPFWQLAVLNRKEAIALFPLFFFFLLMLIQTSLLELGHIFPLSDPCSSNVLPGR